MSELKKCPFCGSGKVSFHEDEEQILEDTTTGFIWCHGCDFSSDSFYNKGIATEKWNRRAQPENEPIVRCGECIHFEPYDGEEYKGNCNELVGLDSCMYEDDYCSYGERKPERSEGKCGLKP